MKKKLVLIPLILIILLMFTGCSNLEVYQHYTYNDTNYNIGNKAYNEEINEINIDWIVGNIYIIQSSNHEIIIREETDIKAEDIYKMHYKLENKILDIKFCGSIPKLDYSYRVKDLYVFLPSQINKITINNVSSDIEINNVKIYELDINNVNGDILIQNNTIEKMDVENISGEIILLENIFSKVEIASTNGNIGMSFVSLPKELDITALSANITLYILNTDIVSIEFETISGKLESNLQYTKNEDTYIFNGKLDDNYEVETVSGSLVINKK